MAASNGRAVPARVQLWGFAPRAARLRLEDFPTRRRLKRALKPLAIVWVIALVMLVATLGTDIIITPLVFAVGAIFAWRAWRGRYQVCEFEGRCPRCDAPLELPAGANITLPHTLDCMSCGMQPALFADVESLDEPPSADEERADTRDAGDAA